VLDRVIAQNCGIGIDLGHYNAARTYALNPPQNEAVTLLGCVFGVNRIALIIGGTGTRGVSVIGGYFESSTESNIDIGHNTVDFAGLAQEGAGIVSGVNVTGCYFQTTVDVCRVWANATIRWEGNNYNGPVAPIMSMQNAAADNATVTVTDTLANFLEYSGGADVSAPFTTTNNRAVKFLTIDSGEVAPLVINGPNGTYPGIQLSLGGVVQGYFVNAGTAGAFLTDALVGDMVFRSEAHRLLFGVGAVSSALAISGSRVTAFVPVKTKGYTVATLPAGEVGDTAYVTDATAPTFGGALTGGGAVVCPVFHNGTAWLAR
jgi:hypothetical protein